MIAGIPGGCNKLDLKSMLFDNIIEEWAVENKTFDLNPTETIDLKSIEDPENIAENEWQDVFDWQAEYEHCLPYFPLKEMLDLMKECLNELS